LIRIQKDERGDWQIVQPGGRGAFISANPQNGAVRSSSALDFNRTNTPRAQAWRSPVV